MNEWLERAARARARLGDPLGGERPDESFEVTWRRTIKHRVVIILAALGIWAVLLLGRLLDLQVLQHRELLSKALDQQQDLVQAPADRGPIVDRHGQLLAYSVDGASVEAGEAVGYVGNSGDADQGSSIYGVSLLFSALYH